ncbi:cytochrome c [Peribacillus cavernae]|uniref:Cytochrome c n=1 Tax=Peribacillus cavernae TaxID=1674310 RepID=A0A3S0WAN3_9BACI|nr:cytochrome c [Peribacillus cavernae]MDQ0218386.1 cytochrome c551 [Peribacillus cavernae]RUQ31394.1 cytochrome c [Peribacillus cavernae]
MKKKLLALLMGTSLVLAACGGGDDDNADKEPANNNNETSTADAGDAAEIYKNNCASCHGQNLEGAVGPKLSDAGSRLSKDEIETTIAEGKGSMPAGIIQGDEASQVADWLAQKK